MKLNGMIPIAVASLLLAGCDQAALLSLYVANNGTAAKLAAPLPLTLPYKDVDGWVLLPARVNGHAPVDFVLDTGASVVALIDDRKAAHLGLDMRKVRRLGAEDDLAAPVGARQDGLRIDFGGLVLEDQAALAIPAGSLNCQGKTNPDVPFNGVIGHDLFGRFTVEVNRDRGTVTLHDPATYRYIGGGRIVAAEISGRQPFVQAVIATPGAPPYKARLHVDSGAGLDLTLFPGSSPQIQTPSSGRVRQACFVGGAATYRTGAPVALDLNGARARSPVEYALGREVVASGQNGRIGAHFLQQYNVIFDYARSRIILEPRENRATLVEAKG